MKKMNGDKNLHNIALCFVVCNLWTCIIALLWTFRKKNIFFWWLMTHNSFIQARAHMRGQCVAPLYLSFPILWQQASYSLRAIFLPPDQSALTRSHYRAVMNIRCTAKRNNIMSDGCLNTLHKYNPEYIDYVCPTAGRRPVIIPLLFSVR